MKTILKCKPRARVQTYLLSFVLLIFLSAGTRADFYTSDDWEWGYLGGTEGYAPNTTVMSQLSIAVTDENYGAWEVGADQVLFIFSKSGTADASLTDIFFEDGTLVSIAGIFNDDPHVFFEFEPPSNPSNLPAGNNATPPFVATVGFGADSGNPAEGVDLFGESVGILFNLAQIPDPEPDNYYTLADVIAAINQGFVDPTEGLSLRIGIHVTSIGDDAYSQSYILTPVPGAFLLGILGLSVVGIKLRKYA